MQHEHARPDTPYTTLPPEFIRQQLHTHYPVIRNFAIRLARNAEDADDITQDVMLKALEVAGNLRMRNANLKPWLLRVTWTVFVDMTRKRKVRKGFSEKNDPSFWIYALEDAWLQRDPDLSARMKKMLAELTDLQRTILLEIGVEELSYKDFSARHNVKMGTVMSRMSQSRERARALLTAA